MQIQIGAEPTSCDNTPRWDQLGPVIKIKRDGEDLSSAAARTIADAEAAKRSPDPMLLAWYEAASGQFSPRVECCNKKKPGWLVYAESRGGEIQVVINDLEYVFIYRP
ncbi:MAG: AF1514 family protein [Syntrophobacter sp.]